MESSETRLNTIRWSHVTVGGSVSVPYEREHGIRQILKRTPFGTSLIGKPRIRWTNTDETGKQINQFKGIVKWSITISVPEGPDYLGLFAKLLHEFYPDMVEQRCEVTRGIDFAAAVSRARTLPETLSGVVVPDDPALTSGDVEAALAAAVQPEEDVLALSWRDLEVEVRTGNVLANTGKDTVAKILENSKFLLLGERNRPKNYGPACRTDLVFAMSLLGFRVNGFKFVYNGRPAPYPPQEVPDAVRKMGFEALALSGQLKRLFAKAKVLTVGELIPDHPAPFKISEIGPDNFPQYFRGRVARRLVHVGFEIVGNTVFFPGTGSITQ